MGDFADAVSLAGVKELRVTCDNAKAERSIVDAALHRARSDLVVDGYICDVSCCKQ